MKKNEKITALYERLSRDDFGKDDDQQRESNSISNQKAMLEEFAARQGFTNIVHFTDDGISGTCFDRPGFLAMMKEVEAGNVEYLCIKDMSRMGRDYLEETYGLTNEKKIDNAIGIVANENKYHPIRDYLSSLVWDGTERIRFCLRHFLGADADDYTYEALKLFLLGAISRAFQPGCKFEIMLCLVGGQGAGKSTFFLSLIHI